MQGHHLHPVGAFLFLLLALEHVAQDQLGDGVLDGHLAVFVLFQDVLQGIQEEPDVAHAEVSDLVGAGVLADPVLVVDVHDHAAQGADRVLARAILAYPVHPALEAPQAFGEAGV